MDDPPRARKRARKEPEPDPPPPSTDPKPGTRSDPVPDPDPDPSSPKKLKWDSDPKHWRQPMLPTNHRSALLFSYQTRYPPKHLLVSGGWEGSGYL